MPMPRTRSPLITPPSEPPPVLNPPWADDEDDDDYPPRIHKRWYHYLPLVLAVILMLAPHPSLLIVLVNYHLLVLHSPTQFLIHLTITYTLTFLSFSSLIVVVARDPGPVTRDKESEFGLDARGSEDINFMQALLATDDEEEVDRSPAHVGGVCSKWTIIVSGSETSALTYSAFLHLLTCVTFLAVYVAVMCVQAVYFAFTNPLSIDENTPLHDIYLAFYGIIMALVFGSFWLYHLYLITSNQTTLEQLSPFLLLRHLPPIPTQSESSRMLSNPPLEHELSYRQRRLVREAHHRIRMYDVGWRGNWGQVMGWNRPWGWLQRLATGGGGKGDGRTFPRNPRADDLLARLAVELVDVDKDQ
ncbi:uncharacterized protein FIBRA_07830 [Fibroporia radiculosa]|uniref:Protein S-acyltransferase n=1 Tax=Fibroporia radiculosa TaxID=599839 RepID=J4I1G7_9APHY|nr:uncharacterized protein FIBRA_07830 [Fibroporia radiculosa]CCM05602.1 predicted protein [Fibroporia radiculosa]